MDCGEILKRLLTSLSFEWNRTGIMNTLHQVCKYRFLHTSESISLQRQFTTYSAVLLRIDYVQVSKKKSIVSYSCTVKSHF